MGGNADPVLAATPMVVTMTRALRTPYSAGVFTSTALGAPVTRRAIGEHPCPVTVLVLTSSTPVWREVQYVGGLRGIVVGVPSVGTIGARARTAALTSSDFFFPGDQRAGAPPPAPGIDPAPMGVGTGKGAVRATTVKVMPG